MSIRTLKRLSVLLPLLSILLCASSLGYEAARRAWLVSELRDTRQQYARLASRLKQTPGFAEQKFEDSHAHEHHEHSEADDTESLPHDDTPPSRGTAEETPNSKQAETEAGDGLPLIKRR